MSNRNNHATTNVRPTAVKRSSSAAIHQTNFTRKLHVQAVACHTNANINWNQKSCPCDAVHVADSSGQGLLLVQSRARLL